MYRSKLLLFDRLVGAREAASRDRHHQGNWPRWIGFCSGSNLPPIREDRSTLPIENQSFVNSGEGVLSLHFLFQDLTQYQE